MIVRRLKNTKKGEPYDVESFEFETIEEAEKKLERLWESGGTVSAAIITEKNDVESIYTREWIDVDRVPKGWKKFWKPPPRPAPRVMAATPEPERKPPTIFNEAESAGKAEFQASTLTFCGCCSNNRPLDGYDGESDPTPSGRQADGRCMQCGRPMPGIQSMVLYRMYLAYVSRHGGAG